MKKVLVIIVCLVIVGVVALVALLERENMIPFEQLPGETQTFVTNYFPNDKIAVVKEEKNWFCKKYEVYFTNGSMAGFRKNGEWKEVDCRLLAVPDAIIPPAILDYVKNNYAAEMITKIDKDSRDYEVKLSNRMELKFDLSFNLIDMDN